MLYAEYYRTRAGESTFSFALRSPRFQCTPRVPRSSQRYGGMRMQTAHEFFIHGLTDILSAERQLVEALGKQAEESTRPELQKAFESHREQTEKQIERLEQCFEELGEEPEETECKGIKGLIEEHDSFIDEEDASEDLIDIFNVGAATKVERYEITEYEGLIRLADLMEHTKVSKLLN